ncbi:hypothetical protein IG193_07155 [Infirmifilum lucidum]|uniref:Uncharacterized protein n=1 Tax=Infirmifilum lucidum TaxID=2776706 RepID=A0A7L9FHY3_9CREN|nr:hypothetical protein [Infirmifilum lucidum]QOJ78526.1 hypothetical protein IG193_07155 [Infirmifilum lucidum]
MEDLVKSVDQVLRLVEEGIKERRFPEAMRTYVEQLGRNLRLFLDVVEISALENTIQSPISPSSRGAMFNLRKAFYATLTRLVKEQGVDRNRSLEEWKKAASRLIEEIEKRGITEAPCKIFLTYTVMSDGQSKYISFKDARVFYFDLEGIVRIDLATK